MSDAATRIRATLGRLNLWPMAASYRLSLRAAFCLTTPIVLGIVLNERAYATTFALGTLWGVSQDGSDRWRQRGPRLLQVALAGASGITIGAEFVNHWPNEWAVVAVIAAVALLAGLIEASMYSAPGMYLLLGTIVGVGLGFHGRMWQAGICLGLGTLWVYVVASLTDWRSRVVDQRASVAHAYRQMARRLEKTDPMDIELARLRSIQVLDLAQDVVGTEPLDKESPEAVALRQCLVVALQMAEAAWYLTDKGIAADPQIVATLRAVADIIRYQGAVEAVRVLREVDLHVPQDQLVALRALTPPERGALREGQAFRRSLSKLPWGNRLRFAGLLCLATTLGSIAAHLLDGPRGYWLAMSVAFIFRPDLGPVLRRALARTGGTLAGVAIAAVVALTGNQDWLLIVLVFLMAGGVPWAQRRSHALTVMFFTPIVFVFVSVLGPDQSLFWPRIVDTALAAGIVLALDYFFWLHAPTLRAPQLFERAREEVENYESYDDIDEPTIRHLRRRRALRLVTQARAALAQSEKEVHVLQGVDLTLGQQIKALEDRIDLHTLSLIQKSLEE